MNDFPSGPVTFGQLSMLRSYEFLGPEAADEGNLMQLYAVPMGNGYQAVQAAWQELQRQHHSLRTVYGGPRHDPAQTLLPVDESPLETVELVNGTYEEAFEAVLRLDRRKVDLAHTGAARAQVAMHQEHPAYLLLSIHHIAVDQVACEVLEQDFGALMAGEPVSAGPQPIQLALEQRTAVAQRRQTLEYWAEAWSGFVPGDRLGTDDSERRQAALFSRQAMTAANRIAADLGVSLQAVVLSATALALFQLKDRDAVTFGLLASNRFTKKWEKLVSSMVQLAPLTVAAVPSARPSEFVRETFTRSLEAYSNGAYSVDELTSYLSEVGFDDTDPMSFDCYYNHLDGLAADPGDDAPLATTIVWEKPSYQTGPTFNLIVETGAGLKLSLRASNDYLPPSDLLRCLAAIEAVLVSLAGQDLAAVSDVDITPLRPLPEVM